MTKCYPMYIMIIFFTLLSCKKEPTPVKKEPRTEIPEEDSPTISYRTIHQKLKASDIKPMNLDVNGDGTVDFSFFMQYVYLTGKVHLYAGVNPVNGATTSANAPNDNEYLNMGLLHAFEPTKLINQNLGWTDEHTMLSDRIDELNGNTSYSGHWGSGQLHIMSMRLAINGKLHYGWAQLKFDKVTEELTLVDVAWNTLPDLAIKAGAK